MAAAHSGGNSVRIGPAKAKLAPQKNAEVVTSRYTVVIPKVVFFKLNLTYVSLMTEVVRHKNAKKCIRQG